MDQLIFADLLRYNDPCVSCRCIPSFNLQTLEYKSRAVNIKPRTINTTRAKLYSKNNKIQLIHFEAIHTYYGKLTLEINPITNVFCIIGNRDAEYKFFNYFINDFDLIIQIYCTKCKSFATTNSLKFNTSKMLIEPTQLSFERFILFDKNHNLEGHIEIDYAQNSTVIRMEDPNTTIRLEEAISLTILNREKLLRKIQLCQTFS